MTAPLIQTFGDKTGIEYELCCKLNQEIDSKGNRSSMRGERFETKGANQILTFDRSKFSH
jgi:hypothetical protein